MGTNLEASYVDQHYLNYKRATEGSLDSYRNSKDHPVVGVAIFGLGRIGTIHLENLHRNPRARVIYCVEESLERTNFVRHNWKLEEPETTFLKPSEQSKIYQDKRIDAVVICTPTYMHEEIVLKSLESGKAVFCEKPLALTENGIEKCLAAAEKYNKPLHCAFNRRFDPGMRYLKSRIDAGEIGKIHVIKTCSRDSPRPGIGYLKISGGIYHDCAVHDIDYICWVLGEYPESVFSYAHTYFGDIKELGDYDTVVIVMKFPSGALATIDLSRQAVYGYDQRVEAFGQKGMVTCGEQRTMAFQSHNERGTTAVPIFFSFASRYQEAYKLEMEHFLNTVQGIEECEIKPESILAISKIATACEEVANTGKTAPLVWTNKAKNI